MPLLLSLATLAAAATFSEPVVSTDSTASNHAGAHLERTAAPTAWADALTAASHDEREANFARVVEEAQDNVELRDALSRWAADEDQGELAWTARLALRELGHPKTVCPSAAPSDPLRDPFGVLQSPFGDLQLFAQPGFMDEMRARIEGLMDHAGAPPAQGGPRASQRSSQFRFRSDGNSVRVEKSESIDGEESTTTYEADSLDELLEQHPELREHLGMTTPGGMPGAPSIRPQAGADSPDQGIFRAFGLDRDAVPHRLRRRPGIPSRLRRVPSGDSRWDAGAEVPEFRTDRLGVLVSEPGSWPSADRGLPDDVGLRIERVVANSIAAEVGVRVGEVISEMNDVTIRSTEDVARVLSERESDEPLTVVLVGAGGQMRIVTWQPESEV